MVNAIRFWFIEQDPVKFYSISFDILPLPLAFLLTSFWQRAAPHAALCVHARTEGEIEWVEEENLPGASQVAAVERAEKGLRRVHHCRGACQDEGAQRGRRGACRANSATGHQGFP